MEHWPDNPIIKNCEIFGYSGGKEPEMPKCPVCLESCDSFYRSKVDGIIVGCENCIKVIDSYFMNREEFLVNGS